MSLTVVDGRPDQPRVWSLGDLLFGFALIAALVFAYRVSLAAMVAQWNASPMYSYGFTVPFVSAYLLWSQRDRLRLLTPAPARLLGTLVIAAGLALLAAGAAAGLQVVQQLAFLVSLVGVMLLVLGPAYLRVSWAAVAYLLLMVPLWDAFTEPLHWPFQERSAVIGSWILQAIRIPAYREGTFLTLPNVQLEVARACSGVNYLVAVIALGLPLGYLYLSSTWRRIALLAFAVTVAVLSNGLRVALIGLLAYWEIGSPLHGPFHVLHGLFVAAVGYVALFAGLRVLGDRERPEPLSRSRMTAAPASAASLPKLEMLTLVAVFVLAGSGVIAREPQPVRLSAATLRLPIEIGGWTAELGRWTSPATPMWPGADVEEHKRYRHLTGQTAGVFVGYFARQAQDRELASFRNAALHRRARTIRIGSGVEAFDANLAQGPDGVDTVFWYDMDAAVYTDPYRTKLLTTWNAIVKGRTNGAVVAITMPRASGSDGPSGELLELASGAHRLLQPTLRTPSSSNR